MPCNSMPVMIRKRHTVQQRQPPIVAVGAVVYRYTADGRPAILLIRKRRGLWTLPKGQVKGDEDQQQAVQREVREETGIYGRVYGVVDPLAYTVVKRGRKRHKIVTYYLMEACGGTLHPDEREGITALCWAPLDRALVMVGREKIRVIIRRATHLIEPAQVCEREVDP